VLREAVERYLENRRWQRIFAYPMARNAPARLALPKPISGCRPRAPVSLSLSTPLLDEICQVDVVKNDPNDNRVLECAVAAGSQFIVTGDNHLLAAWSLQRHPDRESGRF
jgi:hypothetical protein